MIEESIVPVKSISDDKQKLGLWVRDGAMGVGTLTFYDPESNSYAALGHGISDYDASELISVESGALNTASILEIKKGIRGNAGEIRGLLNENVEIGDITVNDENGIFGNVTNKENFFVGKKQVPVASKNDVKLGKALMICTVDNDNIPKEYDIEILKISSNPNIEGKGMIIKVTDERLLDRTGGIIQGMSGSPILQNGKLVGAVTHVIVC